MKNILTVLLLFLCSISIFGQSNNGVSLHANIFSDFSSSEFDTPYSRPGNFLIGGQYNYFLNDKLSLNGGVNFLWMEISGEMKNSPQLQAEVFSPYLFLGVQYEINDFSIFTNIGSSIGGKQNQIGSSDGSVLNGKSIHLIPFTFGGKYKINNKLSIYLGYMSNFGEKIKIYDISQINFKGIDIGLSYNLFGKNKVVNDSINKLTKRIQGLSIKKDSLKNLQSKIDSLENQKLKQDTVYIYHMDIEQINKENYLRINENYELSDLIKYNKISDDGKIIIEAYNDFAKNYELANDNKGLYLKCLVPGNLVTQFNEFIAKDLNNSKFITIDKNPNNNFIKFKIDKEINQQFHKNIKLEIK